MNLSTSTAHRDFSLANSEKGDTVSDTQEMEAVAENDEPTAVKKKIVTTVGDFELKKKVGKGATGEVFLARQISTGRKVAVKTLAKELAKNENAVARFLREARSMEKLDHPNIVKFYAADSYKGIHYAAIEFVDGKSVQACLNEIEQFSIGDAVHVAMVTAEALQHAHDQNMVHRDIKPDNILLTNSGVVKVADFGLVKTLDEDLALTQNDTGLGTPLYMSPEQAVSAKTVDHRSDIYSLGATLYHMLTGVLPYEGQTAVQVVMAKEKGMFTSARKVRSEIPERLDLMIDKMMAKDPRHRYRDCSEIVRDLASLKIHNDALSCIEGAQPVEIGRVAAPELRRTTSAMGITMESSDHGAGSVSGPVLPPPTASPAQLPTQDPDPEPEIEENDPTEHTSRTWYIQFEDSDGNTVVKKRTTERVVKLINVGKLTADARAKVSATGNYLPLADFPEFADAIKNPENQGLESIYKQAKRKRKKERQTEKAAEPELSEWLKGPGGTVVLVICLAVIILLGILWYSLT